MSPNLIVSPNLIEDNIKVSPIQNVFVKTDLNIKLQKPYHLKHLILLKLCKRK